MIGAEQFQKQVRDMNRLFYGTDVEIEPHPSRWVRRGKQIFPLQVCRWRVGDMHHAVLLEPILREFEEDWGWPIGKRIEYRLDDEAMRHQLRGFVQSTLSPLPSEGEMRKEMEE